MVKKFVLVTGSAGFIGTNLVGRLLADGQAVIGLDNFCTSNLQKARVHEGNDNYEFFKHDIVNNWEPVLKKSKLLKMFGKIDEIYNLACPASPPRYMKLRLETVRTGTVGLMNALDLAKVQRAKLLQASTSEVYGEPLEHPQKETYWGNVNPVGNRSSYDETKRLGETICYEYRSLHGVDTKIVRIFNTYGPYMDISDGRVISNLVTQAIRGEDLTIYGDGMQTRSFQYIDDLVEGMIKLMATEKGFMGPVNIGNPGEFTILELAALIREKVTGVKKVKGIRFLPLGAGDPSRRKPDVALAQSKLNWSPKVKLSEGLDMTIDYFRHLLSEEF
jgi:UDP-glucuronate decarboxylase